MTAPPGLGLRPAVPATGTLLGLAGADERLLAVLAAAAPFDERAAGRFFRPVRGPGRHRLAERAQRWLRSAVGDDDVSLRALLLHRRRTGRDLGAGLVDVAVRDPARLPDWAEALVDFLLAQPPGPAEDPAVGLVGGVFVAFQRAAGRLVGSPSGRVRGVPVSPEAADDVAGQLVTRLVLVCDAALGFELQLADGSPEPVQWFGRAGIDVSRLGWLERLENLPGLAYAIGLTCLHYKRAVGELFDRLDADLPRLRRELWSWADPGPLTAYSGDSGDLHDGGRTVTVLSFAGGQRVVYKPKALDSVAGFNDLLTFLNGHGLPLDLPTRRVLLGEGYGWEEFVAARPCGPGEDPARFYRRLGALARLAELLECRDLWADNLVAIGERPAFVDLENVLQGRMRKPNLLGERAAALWHEVEESVAKTAVVSYPRLVGPGRRAQDIGCCARVQEQLAVDSDGFPVGWEPPQYRPVVDGHPADPARYADEVLAGYRDMQRCLLDNAAALADERGPLHLLRTARVRYIWRSTWDYLAMLRASLSPLALADGVSREVVLARLFRGAREVLHVDPERADSLELIEREIEALRRLDVPLFRSQPADDTVRTPDGARIDGHFAGTAWQRLRDRLAGLPQWPARHREAVLRTCLDFTAGGAATWIPDPGGVDGDPDPSRRGIAVFHPAAAQVEVGYDELLTAACAAADEIVAAAMPVGVDRHGWIGVVHYPAHGLDQVEPLHGDLLTGTAGLAVFLAELYQSTGRPTYWAFAQDALAATDEFLAVAARSGVYRRMCGTAPVGGFVGIGAAIYALARCGGVIGDAGLLARAHALLPAARAALAVGPTGAEPLLGRSGLLLALLKLRELSPSAELDEVCHELYGALLAEVTADAVGAPAFPAGVSLLASLPGGRDGTVSALCRAAVALGRPGADVLAGHPFAAGTPGAALAALAVPGIDPAAVPGAVALVAGRDGGEPPRAAQLLDRIELGLAGHRAGGDEAYRRAAHRAVRSLLARRAERGCWFPDRLRADRLQLSAVDGLAGAGLACLALAEDDVTSLRLLS